MQLKHKQLLIKVKQEVAVWFGDTYLKLVLPAQEQRNLTL